MTMHAGGTTLARLARAQPPSPLIVAMAVTVLHGAYSLSLGVIMAPDSRNYAYWSERLLDSGFAYGPLLTEAKVGFPAAPYALFATLLALLRLAFDEGWPTALVALNFAAHVGLGVGLVLLTHRLTGSGAAAWGALLLFLGCHDLLQWVNFVLADATFALLAFVIFVLASKRILGEARSWLGVALPTAAGIFYRPTGIVLVPAVVLAWMLSRKPKMFLRRGSVIGMTTVAAVAAAVSFAWLVQDPNRWPFGIFSNAFDIVGNGYRGGEVVNGRLETYHAPPSALPDYVLISLDRFVHFFAVGAAGYSPGHWLVSAGFLLPCYALAGWLLLAIWRGKTSFSMQQRKIFILAAGAILAFAAFHALVQVDFDWRYRTPILPHLILLSAGGIADLLRRLPNR